MNDIQIGPYSKQLVYGKWLPNFPLIVFPELDLLVSFSAIMELHNQTQL